MNRLSVLIKKEFIQLFRDKVVIALMLYYYTACIILCGYAWNFDVKHLRTVIYDMNRTKISRDIIYRFLSTEYFDLEGYVDNMRSLERYISSGKATVGIVIPPEFSRHLQKEGIKAEIQIIVDSTDANQGNIAIGHASRIISRFSEDVTLNKIKRPFPRIDNRMRVFFDPDLKSVYFVVIGHIVIAAFIGSLILPSTGVVREKEKGTIEQLIVTPIRYWEIIAAKAIAPTVVGLLALIPSLLISVWFEVPFKGNLPLFFFFSLLLLYGMLGLGIFIGSICSNMLQTVLLCFLIIFPGVILGGTIVPFESMPKLFRALSYIFPLRYYMIAAIGIFLKGLGLKVLWKEALSLFIFGTLLFYLSIRKFKHTWG
jgi:ABC-2 type transport system permease protein